MWALTGFIILGIVVTALIEINERIKAKKAKEQEVPLILPLFTVTFSCISLTRVPNISVPPSSASTVGLTMGLQPP